MKKLSISLVVLFLGLSVPLFAQRGGHGGGGGGQGGGRSVSGGGGGSRSGGGGRSVSGGSVGRGSGSRAPGGHPGVAAGRSRPSLGGRGGLGGGGGAGRMSSGRYNSYFGNSHQFRPHWGGGWRPGLGYGFGWGHGYPRFWYGGFYWGFSAWPYGMWPYFWGYDDPIYVVVDGGDYYAKNDLHPDDSIKLSEEQKEETGTITVTGGCEGDSIFIDKGMSGSVGELKEFSLPIGAHVIEVRGKCPYFGEDITVIADHNLVVDVPGR